MAMRLGDILVAQGLVTQAQMDDAFNARDKSIMLGDYLVQEGLVSHEDLNRALEMQFDLESAEIDPMSINRQVLRLIPEMFARDRQAVAFGVVGRSLQVAMVAPDEIETIAEIELMTGYNVKPFIAQEAIIRAAIDRGYDDRSTARQTLVDLKLDELRQSTDDEIDDIIVVEEQEDAPVVRLVQAILNGAVDAEASDIHMEPHQPEMRIRYRVDGELQQVMTIPPHIEPSVVSRIKVMADMNTTETRRAQDGHLSVTEHGNRINFRVSSIPTVGGEKMVLRLLDEGNKVFAIDNLGIDDCDLAMLQQVVEKPHGMFVVTGPTGSGKSTTLYALLSELNKEQRNIVTVEDPVEFRLPGINQVQSDNEHGMGFANALKYIMRQDPDVIMIGEIRDHETATLATQAALTGHLMISTLHTNDAPSAIVRLGDLGIDNFKIAGALIGSIAQRLLRKLCSDCKQPVVANPEMLKRLGYASNDVSNSQFYRAVGCKKCLGTGYFGRMPVFEIMLMSPEIIAAVEGRAPVSDIRDIAKQSGMRDLKTAAMSKAMAGLTSIEEVYYKTIG